MNNLYILQMQLSIHRQRLEKMVQKYGMQHPKVLLQSQKVDKIIFQIQRYMLKHMPNFAQFSRKE
ncbi:hypothetical protein DCCM_4562 [Desulfocucumis palustris]|uniref:Spo0E like sporulation regulatory protein n=1 Tax=Desulfocucumis palustris TaxID=1898651 RepID=A0A2L2XGV4_9FIRM|nr:hypothetical protein DCCM_4562 [Desulfocucumis palustris]